MAGTEEIGLSNVDKEHTLRALLHGVRADGRCLLERRDMTIDVVRLDGKAVATAKLGDSTAATCAATASVSAPQPDRPNDGLVTITVSLSPLAAPSVDIGGSKAGVGGASGYAGVSPTELTRLVERQIRDSRALDVESLVITPGEAVWSLRLDVTVMADGGNAQDAAAAAALAALFNLRKPEVTVGVRQWGAPLAAGGGLLVHPAATHPPSPLALHHLPIATTFAVFLATADKVAAAAMGMTAAAGLSLGGTAESAGVALPTVSPYADSPLEFRLPRYHSGKGRWGAVLPATAAEDLSMGDGGRDGHGGAASSRGLMDVEEAMRGRYIVVADPTWRELVVADGVMTFIVNAHRELCGVHKLGGAPIPQWLLVALAQYAGASSQGGAVAAAVKATGR